MSQCFSKISVVTLIRSLSPVTTHRVLCSIIASATIIWTVNAVLGFIFECQVPDPWNFLDGVCFNRYAFFTFVQVFNLLIDVGLILLPISMFAHLQTKARAKIIVIGCFSSRILYIHPRQQWKCADEE